MKALSTIVVAYSSWIDGVANAVVALRHRFAPPCIIKFAENESGALVLESAGEVSHAHAPSEYIQVIDGKIDLSMAPRLVSILPRSRVEFTLQANRFLFRTIVLPSRAAEFLSGIVRAQIDRLTPWNAVDASFGWSKPVQDGPDRMIVNVAATAHNSVTPYVQAFAKLGVGSISVFAAPPSAALDKTPIKIWDEKGQGLLNIDRIRQGLVGILAAATITTVISIAASVILGANIDAQRLDIDRQISNIRSTVGSSQTASSVSIDAVRQSLARRKTEKPSAVMTLEALSRILPGHTYVTELRIEGNALRLVGFTKDSPSLIALLEQSNFFSRASFFAPTTRSAAGPGERFHIEAILQPTALRS
jgi:general secretion pathway protein L